jgi:hypothetical protein
LVVAESGWGWGFKLLKLTSKKSHLGIQYTFLPLNLLIFFGVHAKTSASSKFLSQKCMCAFVVAGGRGASFYASV